MLVIELSMVAEVQANLVQILQETKKFNWLPDELVVESHLASRKLELTFKKTGMLRSNRWLDDRDKARS